MTLTMTFGDLRIAYDDRILVPRPWTTLQSTWAAALLPSAPEGPVLELCAGAAQIGLLAVRDARRDLVCVDSSPVACAYARENAEAAGLDQLVSVREGDLETALAPEERFALVIADPPWVPRDSTGRFPEDPLVAIDGGSDGLDVARTCVRVAARHLLPGGTVLLQLGDRPQVALLADELPALTGPARLTLTDVRDGASGVIARLD